jgi:hypothetical protein
MSEMAKLATVVEVIAVEQPGGGSGRGNQQDRHNRQKGGDSDGEPGKSLKHACGPSPSRPYKGLGNRSHSFGNTVSHPGQATGK